jgi:hypothetical protein
VPAHTKGEGQSAGAAPAAQHHEEAPVIHTPFGDWTPSGPVAAHPGFVDHDHEPTGLVGMIQHAQAQVKEAMAAEAAKTPEQRAKDAAVIDSGSKLAALSRDMNDKNSKAFIHELDSLNDPELRHQVMADFERRTGKSLESFIKGCNDWNNNGDNRDKAAALQLISKQRDQADADIANMKPEERDKKRQEIAKEAQELAQLASKRDHSDEGSQKIFRILEGKTPAEIEMLRAAMRDATGGEHNLYERIDYGMHKGDEDEAVAMLAGNRVESARAAIKNETDPKRFAETVGKLDPTERMQLKIELLGNQEINGIKNTSDRAVLLAALDGNQDLAKGERIGNLLEFKDAGMKKDAFGMPDAAGLENYDRRKAGNVLREFESMSGPEVKAAVKAYDEVHGAGAMEKMLEARWGKDDDKTEYCRIKAMMEGDKGKDRSLRLQESMREEDKDEREAALRHEKVSEADLHSTDDKVRKHAEEVQQENESFERANVEADHNRREWKNTLTGRHDDTTGHSTKDQLNDYMAMQAAKDTKASYTETMLRLNGNEAAADVQHMADRAKHIKEVGEDRIAAMELLDDGKLSPETEFHRGKGAKEKAEALENVQSNKELEATQKAYKDKYGEDMLPDTKKSRSDMSSAELQIDNVRKYGARAERPAQLEYLLQEQTYKKQFSSSLEMDEDGGGTQDYQRILLEKQRQMLKDPKSAVYAPKVVTEIDGHKLPFPQLVDDPKEPSFDDIQSSVDKMEREAPHGDIHKLDDGLKEGVKKSQFNAVDRQLVEANKAQEEAKKALAERFIKVFSMIAKIAAVLTANPWLIAAIDIAEGLIEMGIKHSVMGEAYDASEDLKMLAITAVADVALIGFSKLGELKGAAKLAEAEALGSKAAMEAEHAATAEAKAEVVKEGAHAAAAGESKALKGAIEEGGSAEKALASEAASKVESKAADMAEGKALQEGESAAAKTAESEVAHGAEGAMSAEKAAEQIKARYGMIGGAAKMATQTVGGGIVQGKSPSDILKGLVTGGLGLVLPGHLAEKAKAAIGNSSLAAKVLGEIASFGTEVTTNTTINVAGGAEGGDALFDSALGAGGGRAQRLYGGHAAPKKEEEHAPVRDEPHAPAIEEHAPANEQTAVAPAVHGEDPVLMGGSQAGSAHIEGRAGDSEHRLAANAPKTVERANAKLAAMDEQTRGHHDELFAKTENRGQQVLLERAVAAGASLEELEQLRGAMAGMSENEVMREFSGAGLVQFFHQSCVPTSYQIAIAEVNPVAALRMRNNPELILQAQKNALIVAGGAQTERPDRAAPPAALEELQREPELRRALDDRGTYDDSSGTREGIDPTLMKGQALHNQLEAVTGTKYEVVTNDTMAFSSSDGEFSPSGIPHQRIRDALDAQQPVLFGYDGHERTILGRDVMNGTEYYIIQDPWHGGPKRIRATDLDMMNVANLTLPAETAATPTPAAIAASSGKGTPIGAGGETKGSTPRDARIAEADPLRERYGPAKLSHPEEFEETIRKLEEAGVDVDFRPGQLGYSPGKGEPGRFIFDPEGSIGALRHEYQHFLDQQADGFPGIAHYMEHPEERWASEYRAYKKEIDFARSQGDYENARRLVELARAEKRSLLGDESKGTPENLMGAKADDEPKAVHQEQVAEVFTGPSLASTQALAQEHPGAHMIAAEAAHPPTREAIDEFEAAGNQFLKERFAESLPPSSLDKIYARYPLPHAKGIENMSARLAEQVKLEQKKSPGISILEANLRAVAHLEAEIESVTNLGPHALDKLAPGGTMDIVYKEEEIAHELEELQTRVQVDPRTGETFRLAVVSGPTEVPGSIAPHSGWGLRNFGTDMSTVFQVILQKVLKK